MFFAHLRLLFVAMAESDRVLRVFDGEMDEVVHRAIASGEIVVFSCRCPGRDGPNEDSAAVLPFGDGAYLLVVADGLGGGRAGARASSLAIETLESALGEAQGAQWPLRTAVLNGIERANEAIRGLGIGACTTLSAVEVADGAIRPYHVGDSMILLIGQRGRLKLQTVAHSPVGFAVEAGLLDEGEAMHHKERHLVSNVLGAPDMRIEVGSQRRIAARDTLLLASDGLSDNLHTDEIVALLRAGPLDAACERLAELARARMHAPSGGEPSKPDDLTFVAFRGLRAARGPTKSADAQRAEGERRRVPAEATRATGAARSSRARRSSPDR
jgi:serine/threonine protein phosphatase PrpC